MKTLPGQVWILVRADFDTNEPYAIRAINTTHITSIAEPSQGTTEITMSNGEKITTPDSMDYLLNLLQDTDETIARLEVLSEGKQFRITPPEPIFDV